jgi:hypothetical protein
MSRSICPEYTLGQFFRAESVYCQRISPALCRWLPLDEPRVDAMTGGSLSVTGVMPHVCSAAVSTPAALQLLQDAGMPVPEGELFRYRNPAEYLQLLRSLSSDGRTVASQYRHDNSELPEESCWIKPSILAYVNNKANLGRLVEPACLPRRTVISCFGGVLTAPVGPLPYVVKAVTDEPTGAGLDVVLCRTAADMARVATVFIDCSQVVVEEFLAISRNLCLNYGVAASGEITFLGCAEQICAPDGAYLGNWFGEGADAPPAAIAAGTRIAAQGFALGYFGLVGIDMAVLADGRVMVYDLNFRINGSTVPLMLFKSIVAQTGKSVASLGRFVGSGSYREVLERIYHEMAKGRLLPLSSYDPAAADCSESKPRILALLLGDTRDEIDAYRRELEETGFAGAAFRIGNR